MSKESATKLKNVLEYLRSMELNYVKDLRSVISKIYHPILQTLMYGISFDSEKHATFYGSLITLLEGKSVALSEEEFKTLSTVIDGHIKVEEMMIENTKELLKTVEDDRFKLILSAIHNDEVIHHKLLLSIKKAIAEHATLTEDAIWTLVWKDSPYHGTPAGD
ncbi:MAG: hypothetical protein N3G48_03770 [Sulfolobales archaeon]|nr:hypothetical protein [Sulfolobales archaeon]